MDRYQTFFLCGTRWKDPKRFIRFADWVVLELKPQIVAGFEDGLACVLSATKPDDYGKRNPSFSGDYFDLSGRLKKEELESFVVVAGVELQLYMKVEFLHLKTVISPTGRISDQPIAEVPNGMKIVSMSLREDIWYGCQKSGLSQEITRRWEELFITSGALYGYAGSTHFPKTDKFAQVNPQLRASASDDKARGAPKYVRVIDFDYTRFVEGVYLINYISKIQLDNSGRRSRIVVASTDVRSRVLRDAAGNEVGMAVELENDSEVCKQHCTEILGNLLWDPTESD